MSATLGALVIAISTEFSVLLSERYRQERAGRATSSRDGARAHLRSTGAAVLASGHHRDRRLRRADRSPTSAMLRDFGFVTVVDLTVSLVGVLLVLPAVLVLAERGDLLEAARSARVRRAIAAAGGRAGAPRVA